MAKTTENNRLAPAAWIDAALAALATHGIDGVRVELLAKRLKVTKGSFYWHFRDREALLQGMLAQWRRRATLELIERLDRTDEAPVTRLRRLLRLPIVGRSSREAADVELSIRLWARHDSAAAMALEEVDQLRLRYIAGLLKQGGVEEDEAYARAVLAYSYIRVASTLIATDEDALMETCEQLLIGSMQLTLSPPAGST